MTEIPSVSIEIRTIRFISLTGPLYGGLSLTGPLDPVDSRDGQLILDKVCMSLRQWSGASA
jgi:hypothetical protein